MDEKLKTTLLEYDKSTFLIDLVKHDSGVLYVAIQQTIQLPKNKYEEHEIKINPSVLADIIEVLSTYKKALPKDKASNKSYFSPEQTKEIIKRYLKGSVEIKHLAIQFDCTEQIIEQILNNNGIAIVTNKIPVKKYFRRRKKRK